MAELQRRILDPATLAESLEVGGRTLAIWFVFNARSRRYRLTFRTDGSLRCTIPRRGSLSRARQFVEHSRHWITRQLRANPYWGSADRGWGDGSRVWFRGEEMILIRRQDGTFLLGSWELGIAPEPAVDCRPWIESRMAELGFAELPWRTHELASHHNYMHLVRRVAVRGQRTRWGSCSRRGTVSLNWRLVQTPESVRDYIILHELAHLQEMNHSDRFWKEVARLCPDFKMAEKWLRRNGRSVLSC